MDFEVDQSDNKRLVLTRFIQEHSDNVSTTIYLTPTTLWNEYGINLSTIQSLVMYLRQRGLIEVLQEPNLNLSAKERMKRDDEEDAYVISVNDEFNEHYREIENTAVFYGADNLPVSKSNKLSMLAELSFTGFSVPTVKVGASAYKFPSMRNQLPFTIINFCFEKHPDRTISLDKLKAELKAGGEDTAGLTNLKDKLRKTLFGEGKPLSPFVVVSAQAIQVRVAVELSPQQFVKISKASNKQA